MSEKTVSGSELSTEALISLYSSQLGVEVAEGALPVGAGWESLVRRCILELRSLDGDFTILQIKEKFGGLRFYFSCRAAVSDACSKIVAVAEANAGKTCELCGEAGEPSSGDGYWVKTLCPQHVMARDIANLKRRLKVLEKAQADGS